MADYIRSEEETIEGIKDWFAKNGLMTLIVIVVAVGSMIGWRSWQSHERSEAGKASQVYETMMTALQSGHGETKARSAASSLVKDYQSSSYADYAHLVLAKLAVQDSDLDSAVEQLKAVADKPATKALGNVARLRLARVYMGQGNLDAAEKQISRTFPKAWQGPALELKGDIAHARNKNDAARDAYITALDAMQSGADRDRVQMKLDDLKS